MDSFFVIWFIFVITIIVLSYSNAGKNIRRKFFAGEIVEDYGMIGKETMNNSTQEIRLLKCKKNGQLYFVLEIQQSSFAARRWEMIKISSETAHKLRDLLK